MEAVWKLTSEHGYCESYDIYSGEKSKQLSVFLIIEAEPEKGRVWLYRDILYAIFITLPSGY